jgi:hypothetical protein
MCVISHDVAWLHFLFERTVGSNTGLGAATPFQKRGLFVTVRGKFIVNIFQCGRKSVARMVRPSCLPETNISPVISGVVAHCFLAVSLSQPTGRCNNNKFCCALGCPAQDQKCAAVAVIDIPWLLGAMASARGSPVRPVVSRVKLPQPGRGQAGLFTCDVPHRKSLAYSAEIWIFHHVSFCSSTLCSSALNMNDFTSNVIGRR